MAYYDLTTHLFLQIAIILLSCQLIIWIGTQYFEQTEVVCEMLTGIVLGPSIFGMLFPELQYWIFPNTPLILENNNSIPNPSMTLLFSLSQIGIVLYMFITGLEFNIDIIRKKFKSVIFICSSGILTPFVIGALFITFIDTKELIIDNVSKIVAAIYFGSAISITAFPVLVRIMDEKRITKSSLGSLALISASIEDAFAWGLIALVLTISIHNPLIVYITLLGTLLYVILMIFLGKILRKVFPSHFNEKINPTRKIVSFIFIILMLCAVIVDKIGLYSAFGSFIAGTIMPKGKFAEYLRAKLQFFSVSCLLPLFFTFTGLNTNFYLINTYYLWMITFLIIVVAVSSKLIPCIITSHSCGINWRDATAYGVLMNTRGVMELIILNIGLQNHIISPTLFTMMVIMTLVTTTMASPLLTFILKKNK
ncbi:MAG: cation:proton antiporter [Gammaproteobacteria bacterium]|nr:cation:proton antiporter [Gammaproteobacteria bacterium]MCW5583911.1 cation:proton antiporter [Gammaproteobacteria bacterium]